MRMGGGLVAQDVIEQVSKSVEHMFDRLKTDADGLQDVLQAEPGTPLDASTRRDYAVEPSDDQISSFVRIRSTTVFVKS
jgi:hypothetical protein